MRQGIKLTCFKCRKPLKRPGGLLFSPPSFPVSEWGCDEVYKYHLCKFCYKKVFDFARGAK